MSERLELVQRSFDNLTLVAPIADQLTSSDLNVGAVLTNGQRIGQVDTADVFKVSAFVDELHLDWVAKGQRATV